MKMRYHSIIRMLILTLVRNPDREIQVFLRTNRCPAGGREHHTVRIALTVIKHATTGTETTFKLVS